MNSHSRPVLVTLLLGAVVTALRANDASATHVTVRADGSGDYPTINSAIVGIAVPYGPDTLIIEPGKYDEIVRDDFCLGRILYAPAGPALTHVRGFQPEPCSSYSCKVVGVTIDTRFTAPNTFYVTNSAGWRWEACVFDQGFEASGSFNAPTERCTFRGATAFHGFNHLADCRFEGGPAFFANEIGYVEVLRCTFRGPADDLVIAFPRDESGMAFKDCTFSDAANGIRVYPVARPRQDLHVHRCRFEHLTGSALEYVYDDAGAQQESFFTLSVDSSRVHDVGQAVRARVPQMLRLTLFADTIAATRAGAVEAAVRDGWFERLDVSDVAAEGIHLLVQNFANPRYPYEYPPASLTITDCHVRDCGSNGVRIDQVPNPTWDAGQAITVRRTLSERNAGAGLMLDGESTNVTECVLRGNGAGGLLAFPDGAAPACSLSNNTVIENGRRGIEIRSATGRPFLAVHHNLVTDSRTGGIGVLGPFTGSVARNDVFGNRGAAFSGPIPREMNLEVDPLYCAPVEGDFHLRSDSPCAPGGAFGWIGALGVGCAAPAPLAETIRLREPLAIGPNPTRGPVTFSWGSRDRLDGIELFDVQGRRRWSATGEALHDGAFRWNGRGSLGERLPTGVYLVRWRAGEHSGAARLVLLDR